MAELNHFRIYEIAQSEAGEPLELARDGDFVVCLGFDTARRRFVEINALGSGDGERFLERAAAVASQPHPALACVVDSGLEENVAFYAADVVDGEALLSYAGRLKAVPVEAVLAWIRQLAEGAVVLEAAGMRPEVGSARLAFSGGRIGVRIVDFGILRDPDADVAPIGQRLAHFLRVLTNYQAEGEEPVYPPEVDPVCAELEHEVDPARCLEILITNGASDLAPQLGESMRPRLLFEREMFRRVRPEHILPQRLRPIRRAGEVTPYESIVSNEETGGRSRVLVLPPERFVSEHLLDVFEATGAQEVLRVGSFWKHDDFRLLAEELRPGFSLAEWVGAKRGRAGREIVGLLEAVDAVMIRLGEAGVRPRELDPEDILFEFDGGDEFEARHLLAQVSASRWPAYRLRLRTHPTMRSLTAPTDNAIPDEAVEVLEAARRGDALPAAEVFAWYLNLRNRGLAYQAGELVESLRDAVSTTTTAEPVSAPHEPASPDEFDEEAAVGDWADDEPETAESTVLSPIAVAMGVSEDDLEERDHEAYANANPIAQQVATYEDSREIAQGQILPEEESDDAVEAEEMDEVSPFSQLEPPQVDLANRDLEPPLDDGPYRRVRGRGAGVLLLLFILLTSVAIAAAIAHLTGRAFWQQ